MKLITKIAGMAILLGIDSPAARADVRLTTQVVVRPISTVARPSADAAPLPQGLATPGETKTYIAGGSVRIEQLAGTVRVCAGSRAPDVSANCPCRCPFLGEIN